jgi:hypothetical protein
MESNGLATLTNHSPVIEDLNVFSAGGFDHAQRIAKVLADSTLVPETYRGKVSNCLIALEMSNRINASPLMVMQNLHVIQGRPSWSSPFIIATINTCGRFTKLNFRKSGEGDEYGYEAYAKDKKSGEELVGPKVTWKMVKDEGWLAKGGSKWKTMPELMFQYRSAAFFGRLHAPDILMGMHTVEESMDIVADVVDPVLIKESKEDERITLLIKEARCLADLQKIQPHVKPEQIELFNERMRDLS